MIAAALPESFKVTGLYSPSQAARLLGVSRGTIYNMMGDGRLKVRIRKATMRPVITGYAIQAFHSSVM